MLRGVTIKGTHTLAGIAAIYPPIKLNRRVAPLALDSAARDTQPRIDAPIVAYSPIGASIDTATTAATPYTHKRLIVAIYLVANNKLTKVKHRAITRIDN